MLGSVAPRPSLVFSPSTYSVPFRLPVRYLPGRHLAPEASELSQSDRRDNRTSPLAMRLATAVVLMIGSSYFVMLLDLVRGIILMRLLGPTGRGITRGVNLLTSYLDNTHLGVRHGISKRLPQAVAAEDHETADALEDVAFTFILGTAVVSALGVFVWALVASELQAATAISLALGGALLLGQQGDGLYQVVLRAFGRFRVIAKARVVFGLVQFGGMILGAWRGGVVGAMVGWVAAYAAMLVYYHIAAGWRVRLRIRWDIVRQLIIVGLPICAMTLSDVLLRSIEGIIIVKYFKVYGLGLYGAATQIAGGLYAMAQAAQFVIWPRVLDCHARDGLGAKTCKNVILPTIGMATLMPVLCGAVYFIIPPLITSVVPKFAEATAASQVLAMSVCLLAVPIAANTLLVATDKESFVTLYRGIGTVVIVALSLMAVASSPRPPLELFAWSAAAGYLIAGFLALRHVLRQLYATARERVTEMSVIYAPTAWAIGVILAIIHWARLVPGLDGAGWLAALIKAALFLIATAPVLWYADMRLHLRREFGRMARELRHYQPPPSAADEEKTD